MTVVILDDKVEHNGDEGCAPEAEMNIVELESAERSPPVPSSGSGEGGLR